MNAVAVTQKLWVMPQPVIDEFSALTRRGFALVVNNRPDREDPGQPGSQAEERAARAAGLAYFHLPVTADGMTMIDARHFQEAIDAASGPVVAHCRSGARSFYLWIMTGDLDGKRDEEVLALADELHLDPSTVAARLAVQRCSTAGENI